MRVASVGAVACFSSTHTCFLRNNRPSNSNDFWRNRKHTVGFDTRVSHSSRIVRLLSSENHHDDLEVEDTSTIFATSYHAPVMWRQCIDALLECSRSTRRRKNEDDETGDTGPLIFVDGTLGGGGHSAALLEHLQPGDIVFGCDVDPKALETASERLEAYMGNNPDSPIFVPVQSNFCDLASALSMVLHPHTQQPILPDGAGVDGILLDLGVSSHQIDTPGRGFAFMKDGPLDMRMGPVSKGGLMAADICNEFDPRELQRIFSVYGDEPRAKTIANAIVDHRPLTTTGELVQAISSVTHQFAKHKRMGRTSTLARVFQSLRIVVNNEDGVLEKALNEMSPSLLRSGGRLVVLSYHSLEDRATKRIMRDGTVKKVDLRNERDIYGNYSGPSKPFKPVGKRQKASPDELDANPRARSATLRIAERS
jgi:16S rRNA (cytosine1402-N4)-methyltransferase